MLYTRQNPMTMEEARIISEGDLRNHLVHGTCKVPLTQMVECRSWIEFDDLLCQCLFDIRLVLKEFRVVGGSHDARTGEDYVHFEVVGDPKDVFDPIKG